MADVRYKPRKAAIGEIANGPEMVGLVGGCAARIASAAGHGHGSDARAGKRRAHGRAFTTTNGARAREFGGAGPLAGSIGAGRV